MDIKDIMRDVNTLVHNYDSGIGIEYISKDERGLHMQVLIFNMDKFLGLSEIAKIINRALKPHKLKLVSLKLKK
jgi:hypothetical protein